MVTKLSQLVKCNNCNLEFFKFTSEMKRSKTGKHYCSRSCAASTNNLFIQRNKPLTYTCVECGVYYERDKKNRSNKICSSCKDSKGNFSKIKTENIKNQSIKEYCVSNEVHPSWKFARIRGLNRSWNKELTQYPCQVCGYNTHVELAHIKPLHSFSDETLLMDANDANNILVLCPNHHWEFDNGKLSLEEIPMR